MKIALPTLPKWQTALSYFFLSLIGERAIAQGSTSTVSDLEMFYYGFAVVIIALVVATVLIMIKARKILGEHGQPLFDPNFPIFKRMTKASTTVAIIMILLVLWGIYLVITYKG